MLNLGEDPMSATEPLKLARGLRELIDSEADLVDQNSTMTPAVVDAIQKTGLFHVITPRDFGGMEADPATLIDVCEELSFASSTAQCSCRKPCFFIAEFSRRRQLVVVAGFVVC